MKEYLVIDTDRPVINTDNDQYGFVSIAKRLSSPIINSISHGGMVIGLEGAWGTGKTSLLNLIKNEIEKSKPNSLYVINLSPWLDGDSQDLILTLISPMSEILDKEESIADANSRKWYRLAKKRSASIGSKLRLYGVKTARGLSIISKASDIFFPGGAAVGEMIGKGADIIGEKGREPTTIELKDNISKQVVSLGVKFLVVIDDLDRLEPRQAVEVVRMVRSVADFPNITYLMCYDRDILSQALENGLQVSSGNNFLQKIIQLTFSMPLLEPFDLRRNFLSNAVDIYNEASGDVLPEDVLSDLRMAVDREGDRLRTPREVKLALNSIRFIFPSVKDHVYYPDLCRINIIKLTFSDLYLWIEEYLSLWSVVITSRAGISSDERASMGERLRQLHPVFNEGINHPIIHLSGYLPGVKSSKKDKDLVFNVVERRKIQQSIASKRLKSPIHYRYYFALSSPRAAISEDEFLEAVRSAGQDYKEFSSWLVSLFKQSRTSGGNFFDYIVDRLHIVLEEPHDINSTELKGMMYGLIECADVLMHHYKDIRIFDSTPYQKINKLVVTIVNETINREEKVDFDEFLDFIINCASVNWVLATFLNQQFIDHGRVAESESIHEYYYVFSDQEIDIMKSEFLKKIKVMDDEDILKLPDLSGYLYGWRNVYGIESVREWLEDVIRDDDSLCTILECLKTWSVSDRVYYYLNRSSVELFFNYELIRERLVNLSNIDIRAEKLVSSLRDSR